MARSNCTICHQPRELYLEDDRWRCYACTVAHKTLLFAGKVEFWNGLKIHDCVGVRYKLDPAERYGRITGIVLKNRMNDWHPEQRQGNCYALLRVRMDDGSFRDEHPEHLIKSSQPQLQAVA